MGFPGFSLFSLVSLGFPWFPMGLASVSYLGTLLFSAAARWTSAFGSNEEKRGWRSPDGHFK